MTTGTPASALTQENRMQSVANVNFSRVLHLGMAFETEIRVTFDQQLAIDGAVRVMTNRAALPQGFMFEHNWTGLFAMTLGATIV
jgi:hypothetical protein